MKVTPEQPEMPATIRYQYTGNTIHACLDMRARALVPDVHGSDTVAAVHMAHAVRHAHPLLMLADNLHAVACLHKARFGRPIAQDHVAGQAWVDAWRGVHGMLNMDYGPIDNGTVSKILYEALEVAGFGEDLEPPVGVSSY